MGPISRRSVLGWIAAAPLAHAAPALARGRPIDEQGFVRIGGIDQWIAIQGEDAANPAVVYLHGGPAEAQSPFLAEFRPWEAGFTVVNWDQRGSGRTYGRNGASTPDMTLDRMAADVAELAEHARRRLGKRKVILVGQSWGTILALTAMKRRPDLFHAYVGTGQSVNWSLAVVEQERWARLNAEKEGDAAALATLDAVAGLEPADFKRINASSKWRMSPSDRAYLEGQRAFLGAPPFPKSGEVADWIAGSDFTGPRLWPVVAGFDVRRLGLDMPVPFFVIQGRDDHVTPFSLAQAYVAEVRAPRKAFIPIDGGHFACFTHADQFVAALGTHVRPLALDG